MSKREKPTAPGVSGKREASETHAQHWGLSLDKEPEPAAQPPKRPVAPREGLRFGIDIDGTISEAPRHFKRLIDALLVNGNVVYIVTGRFESRREETAEFLSSLGIRYTEMIMRADDWAGTVAHFKVKVVREKQLHLVIDDEIENCWAITMQTEALAAHMLPFPGPPEEWEVDATEIANRIETSLSRIEDQSLEGHPSDASSGD